MIDGIIVKNAELDEPYCYREWNDENNTWVGVGEYDPEKIIPGYVFIEKETGYIYWLGEKINLSFVFQYPPIGKERYRDWVKMLDNPDYPSAKYNSADEEKAKMIFTRCTPSLYEKTRFVAEMEGRTISALIRYLVSEYCRKKLGT